MLCELTFRTQEMGAEAQDGSWLPGFSGIYFRRAERKPASFLRAPQGAAHSALPFVVSPGECFAYRLIDYKTTLLQIEIFQIVHRFSSCAVDSALFCLVFRVLGQFEEG
jgi:hypothetical protein